MMKKKIDILNYDILKNMLYHILLCKLSYKNSSDILNEINKNNGNNEYKSISFLLNKQQYYNDVSTDCQAYSWIHKDTMYIIFRGTSSFKDALIDLSIILTKFENNPDVNVHSGFYKQYKSIENDILKNIDNSIKKISVSGHSLGGGIACIASTVFALKFPEKEVSCYTYGCPRPGNKMFKKLFKSSVKKYYRIVMCEDPVTMIPTNCWYNHVCKGIKISDSLDVEYIYDNISWFNRLYYICTNINYSNIGEDHHTYVYENSINKLLNIEKDIDTNTNTKDIDIEKDNNVVLLNNNIILDNDKNNNVILDNDKNNNVILDNNKSILNNNSILQYNLTYGILDYNYNLYILECNNRLLHMNNQILNKK